MASSLEANAGTAALFNLIVYTETDRRVPYFHTVVDSIIEKFPCRILFVRGDPIAGASLFRVEKSIKQTGTVACDQIEIHATGSHLKEVPYFILPHLAPDLPIIVLWGEDPTKESPVLSEILSHTDRLIIDAENSGELKTFARSILKQKEKLPYTLVDMHWARLAGWRHVIATTFDSEEKLKTLQFAKSVKIVYNNREAEAFTHPEIGAHYLEAWLASRLNWQTKRPEVTLEGELFETFTPAAIIELYVECQQGCYFHLTRKETEPRIVRVRETSSELCNIPFSLPLTVGGSGPSFIKELLFAPSSPQYLEMLKYLMECR